MQIALAFALGLVLMLIAATLFTNAVEWGARSLGLGHGMTGSVMAAVGTAMPETIVPVVALISGGHQATQTATGAILGAPLMLATIGLGLVGVVGLLCGRTYLRVGGSDARRVLWAFSMSFVLLIVGAFLPTPLRWLDAAVLVLFYVAFVRRTMRADVAPEGDYEPLWFSRLAGGWNPDGPGRLALPAVQAVVGLAGLALASEIFLFGLHRVASVAHLSPLVLALLLVPIATELPEVTAGTLWIRRDRDSLALGNVTGSMVFQATFPAIVGLCFTPWRLSEAGFLSAGITGVAVIVALFAAGKRGVSAWVLAPVGVGLYLIYALAVLVVKV
ncbi:MAG: sodium:calcium antiporter [Candidatus Dormiibacterota bacterium]